VRRVAAWLRYRFCRAAAVQGPWFWADDRYPRTVAGGVRYFREQVAPAEVFWYERQHAAAGARREPIGSAFGAVLAGLYAVALIAAGLLVHLFLG
jgi:hypothetical protein